MHPSAEAPARREKPVGHSKATREVLRDHDLRRGRDSQLVRPARVRIGARLSDGGESAAEVLPPALDTEGIIKKGGPYNLPQDRGADEAPREDEESELLTTHQMNRGTSAITWAAFMVVTAFRPRLLTAVAAVVLSCAFHREVSAQLIDFEVLPDGTTTIDEQEISDQYEVAPFHVRFRVVDLGEQVVGLPEIAKVGEPRTAFVGCPAGSADMPLPDQDVGQSFLAFDVSSGTRQLLVSYVDSVSSASGVILDVDRIGDAYVDQVTISARDADGVQLAEQVLTAPTGEDNCKGGGHGPGDAKAVSWLVESPNGLADIASLLITYTGTPHPDVGLAFDNFEVSSIVTECSLGAVNSVVGEIEPVLFVNGSSINASVSVGEPITVLFEAAPQGPIPATYVLWLWRGEPSSPFTIDIGSSVLGCAVNPTPFQPLRSPQAFRSLNGGMPDTSAAGLESRPTAPEAAPWGIIREHGISQPGTFTLQGVVQDEGASNPDQLSVTNAVVLRIE